MPVTLPSEQMSVPNSDPQAFAVAQYISTKDERSLWKELRGAEAKRKFLTTFWDGRDDNPATQQNVAELRSRGVTVVDPDEGYLACGMTGAGRLASVAAIAHSSRPSACWGNFHMRKWCRRATLLRLFW